MRIHLFSPVPKTLLDSIVTDPLQLQPVEIYQNKAEDIASFEITREGQPALSFDRDKDKNWKLAKGDDKANTINVQSPRQHARDAARRSLDWRLEG
jgi:hypothetical protein